MLQYLDDTQVNWKTGMNPFISNRNWGGGLHVPFISTSMRGVGVVYDINIESKINLAGNAIIKNICYRLLEVLVHVTKMRRKMILR